MSAGTIARTIVLIIALINQVLTVLGYSPLPFVEEQINELISLCFTIGASAWAWWKNNSVTKAAQQADEYLHQLRMGGK